MEKYAKPGLKVVQTPWEAALNSGSASTAFVEENNLSPYPTSILTPSPTPQIYDTNQGGIYQQSPTPVGDIANKLSAKDDYNLYQPTTKGYQLPQVIYSIIFFFYILYFYIVKLVFLYKYYLPAQINICVN